MADGFSEAERAAMRARAEELRAERGGRKKAADLETLLETIAGMPDEDRRLAERVHATITRTAPQLLPRTWYGMPAYADGKDVVCFLQVPSKFDTRYATLGFNDVARLDDGEMWPTAYALSGWSPAIEAQVEALVARAVA